MRNGWCVGLVMGFGAFGFMGCKKSNDPSAALENLENWGPVAEVYATGCASCHGEKGEGSNPKVVPAVAGLPDYYVVQELIKFQSLMRGAEADAPDGVIKMHGISTGMTLDLMQSLGVYIAGLPPVTSEVTVSEGADLVRGQAIYESQCAECHGQNAEGDPAKMSPPLFVFQDWYLGRQIEKFQTGDRKRDPANEASLRMHAKAMTMVLEEDVRDVTGFIVSRLTGVSDAEP